MSACCNCHGITIDEECVGKIIKSVGTAQNICVRTDEDNKEFISFDAIVTFTDGTKANIHVPKAYPHINNITVDMTRIKQDSYSYPFMSLKTVEIDCGELTTCLTIEPIRQITKAEIEKELGYKIEIVEK